MYINRRKSATNWACTLEYEFSVHFPINPLTNEYSTKYYNCNFLKYFNQRNVMYNFKHRK